MYISSPRSVQPSCWCGICNFLSAVEKWILTLTNLSAQRSKNVEIDEHQISVGLTAPIRNVTWWRKQQKIAANPWYVANQSEEICVHLPCIIGLVEFETLKILRSGTSLPTANDRQKTPAAHVASWGIFPGFRYLHTRYLKYSSLQYKNACVYKIMWQNTHNTVNVSTIYSKHRLSTFYRCHFINSIKRDEINM